jgi:hypothetical protein
VPSVSDSGQGEYGTPCHSLQVSSTRRFELCALMAQKTAEVRPGPGTFAPFCSRRGTSAAIEGERSPPSLQEGGGSSLSSVLWVRRSGERSPPDTPLPGAHDWAGTTLSTSTMCRSSVSACVRTQFRRRSVVVASFGGVRSTCEGRVANHHA